MPTNTKAKAPSKKGTGTGSKASGKTAAKPANRTASKGGSKAKRRAAQKRRQRRELAALIGLLAVALVLIVALRLGRGGRDAAKPAEAAHTPAPTQALTPTEAPTPSPTPELTPEPMPTLEPVATVEPTPTPEPPRVKIDYPYAIVVDRGAQVVTILTVGETGDYDVVARRMICSTDIYNYKPTNGVYKLDGQRIRWLSTLTGSYAQYATRISGTILFHSIPYSQQKGKKMMTEEYEKLGQNVSAGCVRLTCEDAKWIYENVPDNTLVRFVEGDFDAGQLQELAPPALGSSGWDPTDADPDNPDYIGGSYHDTPVATPYPYLTPNPTSYPISIWKRPK